MDGRGRGIADDAVDDVHLRASSFLRCDNPKFRVLDE